MTPRLLVCLVVHLVGAWGCAETPVAGTDGADVSAPDGARFDAHSATQDGSADDDAMPAADAAAGPGADSGLDAGVDADLAADSDGDGLRDGWEIAAADEGFLDWELADTDGDGTPDGDEDPDDDGLVNREEQAAASRPGDADTGVPDPFRVDLLLELDAMVDRPLSDEILGLAAAAFADLPTPGVSGRVGVGLRVYRDEEAIPVVGIDHIDTAADLLRDHGPTAFLGDGFPVDKLVHVLVAEHRVDLPGRAGETIVNTAGDIEGTGVVVYRDNIESLTPLCSSWPDPVTTEAMLVGTLIHELGHVLQLGHDTEVGDGINHWNVMSQPTTCEELQRRFHGYENDTPALGATTGVGGSRFSAAAADLMDFGDKVSVDTSQFTVPLGYEM